MLSERDQWLAIMRPLLGSIRSHSSWMKYHSQEILDKVNMLPYRPDFETEAEAEMDAAIEILSETKATLHKAREIYAKKKKT